MTYSRQSEIQKDWHESPCPSHEGQSPSHGIQASVPMHLDHIDLYHGEVGSYWQDKVNCHTL
jgi:hypothetical protein